jgi:hypothetical protein
MKSITRITPEFAVSPVLAPESFVAMVFKSVISNLPDGELPASSTGTSCDQVRQRPRHRRSRQRVERAAAPPCWPIARPA